jgi:hypothetical protein
VTARAATLETAYGTVLCAVQVEADWTERLDADPEGVAWLAEAAAADRAELLAREWEGGHDSGCPETPDTAEE